MTAPHDPGSSLPSLADLHPGDAPDLLDRPVVEDDVVDLVEESLPEAWESDQADEGDSVEQVLEVGFGEEDEPV
jgi:hypothetical protein